jgi:hypothetical protein
MAFIRRYFAGNHIGVEPNLLADSAPLSTLSYPEDHGLKWARTYDIHGLSRCRLGKAQLTGMK